MTLTGRETVPDITALDSTMYYEDHGDGTRAGAS
jgi:hypothetical protein